MATVTLEHVHKRYDNGHVAVRDATFEVRDGELLVLVGPSGCGKSTLLRLIAGLESISSGEMRIDEVRVNDLEPKQRDIAMVFQSYALYPHMTVRDNLAFGMKLRDTPKAEIEKRVLESARVLGLESMLDRLPRQLSGGQRQRVALGRALIRNPKVFLLDEPLSNLDAGLRLSMRGEIARLHRRLGATMVYVTHDQIEAMTLGHRIVVLKDGDIQQIDTPMALYERPANVFVAGFLGSPAMNLLRGRLLREGDVAAFQIGAARVELSAAALPSFALAKADHDVVLGLRPERLRLGELSGGEGRFQAVIETVEPVGNEAFLGLRVGGELMTARVPPAPLPAIGDVCNVGFSASDVHLFDAQSGERLS
jgi:multiple sugar transport system ATP-binding protein